MTKIYQLIIKQILEIFKMIFKTRIKSLMYFILIVKLKFK